MPVQKSVWLRFGLPFVLVLACCALPALAQSEGEQTEWLDVPHLEYSKPWVQWIFAPLFAIVVLAIGLKNPHRSHLD